MEGVKFVNVIAVWNWWWMPIYMLVFSQHFFIKYVYLNDSIDIWHCCNQEKFLDKDIIMKSLANKISAWNFLQLLDLKKHFNSTQRYIRKIWVNIPSYVIFRWSRWNSSYLGNVWKLLYKLLTSLLHTV